MSFLQAKANHEGVNRKILNLTFSSFNSLLNLYQFYEEWKVDFLHAESTTV